MSKVHPIDDPEVATGVTKEPLRKAAAAGEEVPTSDDAEGKQTTEPQKKGHGQHLTIGDQCVIKFDRRKDGCDKAIRIPKQCICRGKTPRELFDEERPGTRIMSARCINAIQKIKVPYNKEWDQILIERVAELSKTDVVTIVDRHGNDMGFFWNDKHLQRYGFSVGTPDPDAFPLTIQLQTYAVAMGVYGHFVDSDDDADSGVPRANISFYRLVQAEKRHKLTEEADEAASHFVRLGYDLESKKRQWEPSKLTIVKGDIVQFSWRAEKSEGLHVVQCAKNFDDILEDIPALIDKDGDRKTVFRSAAAGRHYFKCLRFPDAKCEIHVVSAFSASVRKVVKVVAVVIIIAVVFAVAAYVITSKLEDAAFLDSLTECKDNPMFCSKMKTLKRYVFDTVAVPYLCASLIMFSYPLLLLLSLLWPRPTLRSFKKGYLKSVVSWCRALNSFVLLIPALLILMDWALNIRFTKGMNSLLHTFGIFVEDVLDQLFVVLASARNLIDHVKDIDGLNLDASSVSPEIFDTFMNYEGMVRAYAQLGEQLLGSLLNVRLCLVFWSLLCSILCISSGVAGVLRRSADRLRTSAWVGLIALFLVLYGLGFNDFFNRVWFDTFRSYIDSIGNLKIPRSNDDEILNAVSLLSVCNADEGTEHEIPFAAMLKPFNDTLKSFSEKTCPDGVDGDSCFKLEFSPAPVKAGTVAAYLKEISYEVNTFNSWLQKPDADLNQLGLDMPGVDADRLAQIFDHGLKIVKVVLNVLKCAQLKPFVKQFVFTLDRDVLPYINAMVFVELYLVLALVVWISLALILAHLLERPRKVWFDDQSMRWFRFRYCFKIARKVRVDDGEHWSTGPYGPFEPRVPRRCCSLMNLRHGILILNTVMQVFVAVVACMILSSDQSRNPTALIVIIGSILLCLSSVLGLSGGIQNLGNTYNKLLRALSVVIVSVAISLYAVSSFDNEQRLEHCHQRVGYDALHDGPVAMTVLKLDCSDIAPEMPRRNCSIWTTGVGLHEGDKIVALKDQHSGKATNCPGHAKYKPGTKVHYSHPAEMFGREYRFGESLPKGSYTLCWCSGTTSSCDDINMFNHFSGDLYVDEDVDEFRTCSIKQMTGFAEAIYMCATLVPFMLGRVFLGLLTLLRSVYSSHITDRMRRQVRRAHSAEIPKAPSSNIGDQFKQYFHKYGIQALLVFVNIVVIIIVTVAMAHDHHVVECENVDGCEAPPKPYELGPKLVGTATSCNLKTEICGKRVDEVAFPSSHNVMSSEKDSWLFPNNIFSLKDALEHGVRGLMLDVWYHWHANVTQAAYERPTEIHTCHGSCQVGNKLFMDELNTIRQFLESNPRELVVLMFEQYVASTNIVREIQESGLDVYLKYLHPGPSVPWPTVNDLIANGTRLLLFSMRRLDYTGQRCSLAQDAKDPISVDNLEPDWESWQVIGRSYWHYMWDHMVETGYSYDDVDEMGLDCNFDRGVPKKKSGNNSDFALIHQYPPSSVGPEAYRLTTMNHFVSTPLPNKELALKANKFTSLKNRMEKCRERWRHQVNFPTVDFWSFGEVVDAVSALNL